jgi:hypothetical protein
LIDPEDDSYGDANGGHEGVSAAVVAGMDTSPILEPAEHVFDLMAFPIECTIMFDLDLTVGF